MMRSYPSRGSRAPSAPPASPLLVISGVDLDSRDAESRRTCEPPVAGTRREGYPAWPHERSPGGPYGRILDRSRKIMLLSGDRESEVRYLAEAIGIGNVQFGKSPAEKVAIVEQETQESPTLFVGDGIN